MYERADNSFHANILAVVIDSLSMNVWPSYHFELSFDIASKLLVKKRQHTWNIVPY